MAGYYEDDGVADEPLGLIGALRNEERRERAFRNEDARRHPIAATKAPALENITQRLLALQNDAFPRLGDAVNEIERHARAVYGDVPEKPTNQTCANGPMAAPECGGAMGELIQTCDVTYHTLSSLVSQLERAVARCCRLA